MEEDPVDRHVSQWMAVIPDLDPVDEGVITRMQLLVKHLKRHAHAAIDAHGLGRFEYETLHMLAGCGPAHAATPTQIATWLHMSPAGITGRIGALERRGLVRRLNSREDRRKVIVELTATGQRLWQAVCREQSREEARLLAPLAPPERAQLADYLRRMFLTVDHPGPLTMPGEATGPALGLGCDPAD